MHAYTSNAVQILDDMTQRLANLSMTQKCVSSPMQCLGVVVVFTGEGEIKRKGRRREGGGKERYAERREGGRERGRE